MPHGAIWPWGTDVRNSTADSIEGDTDVDGPASRKRLSFVVARGMPRKLHLSALASELIARSPVLCIEDLSVARMLQNRQLSQSLHDVAFGIFVNHIYRHAAKHGHLVLRAGRFDPTSQLCSACGYRNKGLKRSLLGLPGVQHHSRPRSECGH
jgi:transposase